MPYENFVKFFSNTGVAYYQDYKTKIYSYTADER